MEKFIEAYKFYLNEEFQTDDEEEFEVPADGVYGLGYTYTDDDEEIEGNYIPEHDELTVRLDEKTVTVNVLKEEMTNLLKMYTFDEMIEYLLNKVKED